MKKHFWESAVKESTNLKFYPVTMGPNSYYEKPQGLQITEKRRGDIMILKAIADESFGVDIIDAQNNCLATVYSTQIETTD